MLGKLLKYDFRAMFRVFLPLWGALLAVSFVNSFTLNSNRMGISGAVLFIAYIGIIIAIMTVTLVLVVQRFYNGLLKSEGYLMFTLPVRPWQLIASKGISAMVVTVLSVLMAILSILIISRDALQFPEFRDFWEALRRLDGDGALMLALIAVLIFSSVLASIMHIHAALALGHLANSHRIAWAVGAYVGISMLFTAIAGFLTRLSDRFNFNLNLDFLNEVAAVNICLMILILINVLQIVVFFVTTERILSKRLNLE